MKLFDDDEIGDDVPIDPENPEAVVGNVLSKKVDKIFHNDYNTGNLDFEEFDAPKVDSNFSNENLMDCYDSYNFFRAQELEKFVDQYFTESEHGKILSFKKKIPKQLLGKIFTSIRIRFEGSDYSDVEIFSGIAEYFAISYDILYENAPAIYREALVRELNDKYKVLARRKLKNLF